MRRHARERSSRGGFTLVELVVVLLLLGLMATAAVPALPPLPAPTPADRTAEEIAGVLRSAQRRALRQGTRVDVTLDPASGRWWVADDSGDVAEGTVALTDGVRLQARDARTRWVFTATRVVRADALAVVGESQAISVHVDRWTGRVTLADPAFARRPSP